MTVEESEVNESDAAEADSTESETERAAQTETAEPEAGDELGGKKTPRRLRLTITLRSLVIGAVIAALVAGVVAFAWLYVDAQRKLDTQARQSANTARAEKIALDYAVNAAEINFGDLNAWKAKLVAGTSPALKDKLSKAAEQMEQILVPLQWSSTAHPLVAKVRSDTGGAYVIDCFVSVLTKTVQSPQPLQSTATYSVTIDSNKNWEISDVGGIGAVVEHK